MLRVPFFPLFVLFSGVISAPKDQAGFSCTNISNTKKYGCEERRGKLRVFIVADTGGREYADGTHGPTAGQQSVAQLMGQLATEKGLHLVLNLGDNFYEKGVTEKDVAERFKTNFLDIFGTVGSKTVPWYTVAGNRDYRSGGYADIAPQIGKTGGKWTFPAPHYTIHYKFGTNLKTKPIHVRFVMVDTVILCGQNRKAFKDERVFTAEMEKASDEHFDWLDKELKSANDQETHFLFVAGHYPLYLIAGDRSFTCAQRFQELLRRYHVSAYFSGHEHNLKHVVTESGVQVIVAGAGSRMEGAWEEKHLPEQYKQLLSFGYPDSIEMRDNNGTLVKDEYIGGGFVAMELDEKAMEAKINFYAAGHIHTTNQKLSQNLDNREFKYTVKVKSRVNL